MFVGFVGRPTFFPAECPQISVAGSIWNHAIVAAESNKRLSPFLSERLARLTRTEREGVLGEAHRRGILPSMALEERIDRDARRAITKGFVAPKGANKYTKDAEVPSHLLLERIDAGLCTLCGGPGAIKRPRGRRRCLYHGSRASRPKREARRS